MLLGMILFAGRLNAQNGLEGLWEGYDGEWSHVSKQLLQVGLGITRH